MPKQRIGEREVKSRLRKLGITLTGKYETSRTLTGFKCSKGHKWTTTTNSIFQGSRCPNCLNRNKPKLSSIEAARRFRGAEIVPLDDFTGVTHRGRFQCRKGHVWETTPAAIFQGSRCPKCAWQKIGDRSRLDPMVVARKLAAVGIELIGSYQGRLNAGHKLKCRRGHKWIGQIRQGIRCPVCYPHKFGASEAEVRRVIEKLTGWKFPPAAPEFLRGMKTGRKLRLDGYNARHRVAFEYQGKPTHYTGEIGKWGGQKALRKQRLSDKRKRMQCLRHGVVLICIPYWKQDVAAFISEKLLRHGITPAT